MSHPDLSQNEFESTLALALEANGLAQGLCKPAARVALLMAIDSRDPIPQALHWTDQDVVPLLSMLGKSLVPRQRVTTVSEASWKRVKSLASNTYVPESEASKLAGAGAGTHDSD